MDFNIIASKIVLENSLGLIEDIDIVGIGRLKAKTDTGNEAHNVIHGQDVKVEGEYVHFTTENGKRVRFPLKELIKIHMGGGNMERRPVIVCDCVINGKKYFRIPFSVSDRSENNYRVLLGAPFVKSMGGLVDLNKAD